MADVLNKEKTSLVITFEDEYQEKFNFTIANPKENVSESEIRNLANHIVANQYFKTSKGTDYTKTVKARVVASETDKFDLVIE